MFNQNFVSEIGAPVKDGLFVKEKNLYIIDQSGWRGDFHYCVAVNNGTAFLTRFMVNAGNEQEAVDAVVDFCDVNDLSGLVHDYYEMADLADTGETADDFAESNGFIHAGNKGLYVKVESIEKQDET